MQEPMLGHLTVLRSPVPSDSGLPERTETTNPDLKSVKRKSGSPKLRACISIMQEAMLGHLTVLRSPVPSVSGSPARGESADPDPQRFLKSVGISDFRFQIPDFRFQYAGTGDRKTVMGPSIDPQTLDPQDPQRSIKSVF